MPKSTPYRTSFFTSAGGSFTASSTSPGRSIPFYAGLGITATALGWHWAPVTFALGSDVRPSVAEEIRREAALSNDSNIGRPLPLAAHWNTGMSKNSFGPAYQIQLIEKGHHLLPWFQLPHPNSDIENKYYKTASEYYEAPLKETAKLKLPISFVSTQWESLLTSDPAYFKQPPDKNPNVVDMDGKLQREVSPFGPTEPWREVGKKWTSSPMMRKLQEWYPDPPLVVFVSNNEHSKLRWTDVERSRRYLGLYGRDRDDNFKRKVVADGWIKCYRALQEGMREGLINPRWRKKAIFVGYDAFGPAHFARWSGWQQYSLYVPGRIDPWPLAWDGASPSFYVHNWNPSTDYTVWSPQIEAMNWVFMLTEAYRLNPNFWFEISVWDGYEPSQQNDKRKFYARLGQTFSPGRYGDMVQFGMWLLRPRVIREFRNWLDTLTDAEAYFLPIVEAVDRIHSHPMLRRFWRRGQLVANPAHLHSYQENVPQEYQRVARWFLLDTNLDPQRPWELATELPVFSLALVLGQAPEREWLVYAYAPLRARKNVEVMLPGYGPIQLDARQSGTYYHVVEKTRQVVLAERLTEDASTVVLGSQYSK